MQIFIKNNTANPQVWVGQEIQAGASYLIQPHEKITWANNSVLLSAIENTYAIVTDGVQEFSATEGLHYLQAIATSDDIFDLFVEQKISFHEDFILGDQEATNGGFGENWTRVVSGTGSGVSLLDNQINGIVLVRGGGAVGRYGRVYMKRAQFTVSKNVVFSCRTGTDTTTNSQLEFGLRNTSGHEVIFRHDSTGYWKIRTTDASSSTAKTTTVALDSSLHIFKIRCFSSIIRFYIDNVQVETINTNIPTTNLSTYFTQGTTGGTAVTNAYLDFVRVVMDR